VYDIIDLLYPLNVLLYICPKPWSLPQRRWVL
jgi:hypothetical protein